MLFTEKIKEMRILKQIPQRKLAAALDIDTATYCKIEKGERKAKKEQVQQISFMLSIDEKELLTLWLADKVTDIISGEKGVAYNALSIAASNLNQ